MGAAWLSLGDRIGGVAGLRMGAPGSGMGNLTVKMHLPVRFGGPAKVMMVLLGNPEVVRRHGVGNVLLLFCHPFM